MYVSGALERRWAKKRRRKKGNGLKKKQKRTSMTPREKEERKRIAGMFALIGALNGSGRCVSGV
jgi:hypothetical protein